MSHHTAFFDPDAPERIFSATRATISLIADWQEDDDDYDNDCPVDGGSCILKISRDMYFDALTEWLNKKSHHKIGVGGCIVFTSLSNHPFALSSYLHAGSQIVFLREHVIDIDQPTSS